MLFIRNADVYAPRASGLRNLLIGGGKILWIGSHDELPELPGALRAAAETLDLDGARLIPGLIDAHVHVTGGGGEAGFHTRVPPVPLTRFTMSGVTTVVGLLGTDDVARGSGELLANIYALREQGLNAWCYTGGYHVPPTTLTGGVRGDLVFIEAFVGIGEVAISDHRSSQPTYDELLRLAGEAHVAGLMTGKAGILHLHLGDGARGLELVRRAIQESELPARVFNPTHVNRRRALFEEAVALARLGVTVDVTAFPVAEGEEAYAAADAVMRYAASGAPPERITVSSDAGGCLPCFDGEGRVCKFDVGSAGALMGTLGELLAAGMPLEQALAPFTSNPARLLRLAGKGGISAGADADLVALEASGAVHSVIIRGVVHVQGGVAVRRGTFETQE
ncbi:MAG TPA: beta-aspartyl-peptidase [Steroidobacteraceae bacterium]|nr:beta-aspartyl-peptidase [Steroidobacteraceae bacterium]